jgi:hypothetical protein
LVGQAVWEQNPDDIMKSVGWIAGLTVGSVVLALCAAQARGQSYYSLQNTNWPPVPANLLDVPTLDLGGGMFLLLDEDVKAFDTYKDHVGEYDGAWADGSYVYLTWTDGRLTSVGTQYARNQRDIRFVRITWPQ